MIENVLEPALATGRLLIRAATVEDLAVAERAWRDAGARTYLGGPLSHDQIEHRRTDFPEPGTFIVERRDDTQALGLCWLRPYAEDTEVSYLFFPEHWGHGYAREATAALIAATFTQRASLERLVAVTQTANQRSRHLLARIGMSPIDTFVEWGAEQTMYAVLRGPGPPPMH
jgi:RimJ/RimL family protein N-acetyltransferase